MSKVALAVFEELLEKGAGDASTLQDVVFDLCEGKFGENFVSWKGDYEEWVARFKKFQEEFEYIHLVQEGGSEHCYGVFSLKGKIYRAGYSYNGHEYEGILESLKEVKPVEKTVIVYE